MCRAAWSRALAEAQQARGPTDPHEVEPRGVPAPAGLEPPDPGVEDLGRRESVSVGP